MYKQISEGKIKIGASLSSPRHPDKRYIAALVFFDMACQWEAFCTNAFELELKQRYRVHHKVALSIMSSIGRTDASGYAEPKTMVERAESMLSVNSPWARLETDLGSQSLTLLKHAYRIRNYIAHAAMGRGGKDFRALVSELHIPARQRKGLSAGRLLLDYGTAPGTHLFEELPSNYLAVATYVVGKLSKLR